MDKSVIIDRLNQNKPAFLELFNCKILDVDHEQGTCEMEFDVTEAYCHSGNIIQGGFITAMLDSVSSHAVFVTSESVANVSTMELKVSFYAPSLAGRYKTIGRVEKLGYKTAFVSAEMINADGLTTAVLSATAKVIRIKES